MVGQDWYLVGIIHCHKTLASLSSSIYTLEFRTFASTYGDTRGMQMGLLLRLLVSTGSCLVADGQRNGISGECRLVVMSEFEDPYSTAIHTIAATDSREQSRARSSATGTRNCLPANGIRSCPKTTPTEICLRCTYQHVLLDRPLGRQTEDIMDAKTHCRTFQDLGRLQRVLTFVPACLKQTGPGMTVHG